MSLTLKRNLSGIMCLISAVFMLFCIQRMIPYGLAGETAKVKSYFALVILALIVSLIAGLAYYYYRSRSKGDVVLERMQAEVTALSQAGQKPDPTTSQTSQQNRSGNSTAPPSNKINRAP